MFWDLNMPLTFLSTQKVYLKLGRAKKNFVREISRNRSVKLEDTFGVTIYPDFMYFQCFHRMMTVQMAIQHSIDSQTCSGCSWTVFIHIWENRKFSSKLFFSSKKYKSEILAYILYIFRTSRLHLTCSPNKIDTEPPIVHTISLANILVDVYQGFRVSHGCVPSWSNIFERSHSEKYNDPEPDFFVFTNCQVWMY